MIKNTNNCEPKLSIENNDKNSSRLFDKRNKKIRWKIVPSINKIINQGVTLNWTWKWYEIIFKYVKNEIKNWVNTNNPDNISKIFNTINSMTSKLNTKKLYVSYPIRKLEEYSNFSLVDKLKDIVIPKYESEIHNQKDIAWWNCHNWTLLYKDIFDELKISNKIILFEPQSAHSLLLVKINWVYFIADTEGQNKFNFDKIEIWDSISIWNHLSAYIKSFSPFNTDISKKHTDIADNFKPKVYENKKDFINFIDTKERDYFLLEYNEYNEETNEKKLKSFMVSFNNMKIVILIEWIFPKDKIISLWIDKIPKNSSLTNLEIIQYIVKRTNNQIFKDQKNKNILEWIISKIPEWYIQNQI